MMKAQLVDNFVFRGMGSNSNAGNDSLLNYLFDYLIEN